MQHVRKKKMWSQQKSLVLFKFGFFLFLGDGFFFKKMEIAVVGGGDSAAEEALFLTRFATKVYLIHRRDVFRASKIMLKRVMENPKIEIIQNTVVEEVIQSTAGEPKLSAIKIKDIVTNQTKSLAVKGKNLKFNFVQP